MHSQPIRTSQHPIITKTFTRKSCKKSDLLYLVAIIALAFVSALLWFASISTPRIVSMSTVSMPTVSMPQSSTPGALHWKSTSIDKQVSNLPARPSRRHWLGTDDRGRDVLVRWTLSTWTSVYIAAVAISASAFLGLLLGALPAYLRLPFVRITSTRLAAQSSLLFERICRSLSLLSRALPFFFLSSAFAETGMEKESSALGIWLFFSWPSTAHQLADWTRQWARLPYVGAAAISGLSSIRLITQHLLPYLLPRLSALTPRLALEAISMLTAMQYLGIGSQTGKPLLSEFFVQFRDYGGWWFILPPICSLTAIWMILTRIDRLIQRLFHRRIDAGFIEY